jgi:hypothetical protein
MGKKAANASTIDAICTSWRSIVAARSPYGSSLSLVERVQRAQCDSKKAR